MTDTIHDLDIRETGLLLRQRKISVPELIRYFLDRANKLEPKIGAFSRLDNKHALKKANSLQSELDRGIDRGPLHGIPVSLKGNIDVGGWNTASNSHIMTQRTPSTDASIVSNLKRAGIVEFGHTTLHELAFGGPAWDTPDDPARNPWDPWRFTGGSSSGSGAAVAAGLTTAAIGTDTVGSIRLPAAMCGIVGLKPTFGRVPTEGIVPLSYSLDHCGPMASSVEDCFQLLKAMTSSEVLQSEYDEFVQLKSLSGIKIGFIDHFYEKDSEVSSDVHRSMERSREIWNALGAEIVQTSLSSLEVYSSCSMTIMLSEALAIFEKDLQDRPYDFGEITRDRLALASFF